MHNRHPFHTPGLYALFYAVFATVLGVGMAVPLLPLHAHALGATGLHIGLLSGAFAFSRLILAPWFGRRSDRSGRKSWIVCGLLAYAAVSAWLGHIQHVEVLIAARALHGAAAAMLIPLLQAYAADVAPYGREGRLMGTYGAVVLLGLGLGPALGGVLNDFAGARGAFLGMGALAASGAVACALGIPGAAHEPRARTDRRPAAWATLVRERTIAGLIVFRLAHVIGVGMIWSFLPLYMATSGPFSSTAGGLVVGAGIVVSGLLNVPMGALADRADRRRLVLAGGLIGCLGLAGLAGAREVWEFVLASACFGIGGGVAIPATMATVARHGQRTAATGAMMALMSSVQSAGMMTGALFGGLVMDRYGIASVFPAGAFILLGGTCVFALVGLSAPRSDVPDRALTVPLH